MNRICIFSFYEETGHVDEYVPVILKGLSDVADRIIIVANGNLDAHGWEKFRAFTDEIFVRENIGYDAGAYRYVLLEILNQGELDKYDELVFCNDTFFGPFRPLQEIFEEMEKKDCDFWGLNGFFHVVFAHIQSFFLVFRKKILQEHLLLSYFMSSVDGATTEINDVYCQFETGLFDFLSRQKGMRYAIFASECNYDVYRYSYAYLKNYRLPVVKKKAFSKPEEDIDNIWCTLSYIKYATDYDVNLVLDCVRRIYGLNICYEEIRTEEHYRYPGIVEVPLPMNDDEQIEAFLLKGDFYIYGTGMYASKAFWRFARNNPRFQGFIVSEGEREEMSDKRFGYPVYVHTEFEDICSVRILLGVGREHVSEIMRNFRNTLNILRIF